ncbi:MAG: DUF3990 domain-containing protein [Bacteroidales bacterium]|nr:DUF3990 domain-containing protein [Bacteroidales bacterium]
MRVYHGGTEIVEFPDISKGRAGLDFGRGFYVTDLLQQDESWADRMSRIRLEEGIVNVYEFDLQQARNAFSYKKFDNYDVEWLEYIVANRRGEYDGDLYDIVEGGIANDRVIDTVEAYMSDMMPLETALRNLSMHRPNNQLCIRNQQVVDQFLTFVESYKIQ